MSRTHISSSHDVNPGNNQVQEYHGLINQGATCYLNSVLQVLFMTEEFREAVKRCQNKYKRGIDPQLQTLFKNLTKGAAETTEVTTKLHIKNVNEQHDAAEYFERILTKTSDKASQIFKGQLTYRTVCQCGKKTPKDSPFWNLPLPMTDETYTIEHGIQEFFTDSEFSGENQLYCKSCQSKRNATVQCEVKHHPEVLMLLLKRFEFNYHHMSYVKNCSAVDVSLTITIPENQRYELYALVEHFGSLKGGHYTATIKHLDEDRWYEFDDSRVTLLSNQKYKLPKLQKSQSAYLLFYKKKNSGTQDEREESAMAGLPLNNNNTAECQNVNRSEREAFYDHSNEEVTDSRDHTKKNKQSCSWSDEDQRNTFNSSTRLQKKRECMRISGNVNGVDRKTIPPYNQRCRRNRGGSRQKTKRPGIPWEHGKTGSESCETKRQSSERTANKQIDSSSNKQECRDESIRQQQQGQERTVQIHNKVQKQDPQPQTKERFETKSHPCLDRQKMKLSIKQEAKAVTENDINQKEQDNKGDDDQNDNPLITTESKMESKKQGHLSHEKMETENSTTTGRKLLQCPKIDIRLPICLRSRAEHHTNSEPGESTEDNTMATFHNFTLESPSQSFDKKEKKSSKKGRDKNKNVGSQDNGSQKQSQSHCCVC